MSFRNRLTLFFVAIVIVPMVSVAFVLFRLISDNESGKSDARVGARQQTAINLYRDDRDRAARIAPHLASDAVLAAALRAGDDRRARARTRTLMRRLGATRVRITRNGRVRVDVGDRTPIAVAKPRILEAGKRTFGELEISGRRAAVYARAVKRVAQLDTAIYINGRLVSSTLRGVPKRPLPK